MTRLVGRGTMALEDGTGVDFAALRSDRRARVLAAMGEAGVDLLLLGRQGNARYVAGHRPIWRAVVTAWAPFCALRADGGVHLLHTTWDDGVPEEIPRENLTGLSWSPRTIVGDIAGIAGLAEATVVATDGLSSGLAVLLGHLAPEAELVDGEALMRGVRAVKLPAEVECIRTAAALTEGALTTAALEIRAGVAPAHLKGAFHEAMGRYGISHPNAEGRFGSGTPLVDGELVPLEGALTFAGYEAAAGRTRVCGGGRGPVRRALAVGHGRGHRRLPARRAAPRARRVRRVRRRPRRRDPGRPAPGRHGPRRPGRGRRLPRHRHRPRHRCRPRAS